MSRFGTLVVNEQVGTIEDIVIEAGRVVVVAVFDGATIRDDDLAVWFAPDGSLVVTHRMRGITDGEVGGCCWRVTLRQAFEFDHHVTIQAG